MWANEFEIGVVCSALDIICLIFDQQARVWSFAIKAFNVTLKNFQSEANRFVTVGVQSSLRTESTKFVILQRTRREHYNLIFSQSDTLQG